MFLCGNMCKNDIVQPEITVNPLDLPAKIQTSIQTEFKKATKKSLVTLRKSKYKELVQECKNKNIKFTDKSFLPNQKNLNFRVEGRSIVWKRVNDIIKDCVMVESQFKPQEICQGNLKDCYFLSSIAALAQIQERISNIFHENFEVSKQGIYKLVVVHQGTPQELIIDDFVPVFAETNRPVFCKPTGQEIWVMLIQKAWAKIKGSYGAISTGCPHQVLNTFVVAPCYFYQISENHDQQYKEFLWQKLIQAAQYSMPIVAGTSDTVKAQGLAPFHAYTVLDCKNIISYGKNYRIIKFRNPWSKVEYSGLGSRIDKLFWDGVSPDIRDKFKPGIGLNCNDFTMSFDDFMKNIESLDISNFRLGFSYDVQQLKMYKGSPLFVRLNVKQQHEGYISLKRKYSQENNQEIANTRSDFARIIVALQRDVQTFEYYGSMLQNDFPELNLCLQFKAGSYLIMIETDDPRTSTQSQCTFGYYFDSLSEPKGKQIHVQYGKKYPKFLQQVWMNHAIRMNTDKSKIGPKPDDWIKTAFLYNEGGYGYIACSLQHDTSIRMLVTINKNEINQSGFYLIGQHPQQQTLTAGDSKIYVFSCNFQNQNLDSIVYPPPGFKLLRIA